MELSAGERYRCVVKGSLLQVDLGNNIKVSNKFDPYKTRVVDLSEDDPNNWTERFVNTTVALDVYPSVSTVSLFLGCLL